LDLCVVRTLFYFKKKLILNDKIRKKKYNKKKTLGHVNFSK
jgi:hypothetical protein